MSQEERAEHQEEGHQGKDPFTFSGKNLFYSSLGCSGCLIATGIGAPLLALTIPFAILGAVFWNFSPIYRSRNVPCPHCDEETTIYLNRWKDNSDKEHTCQSCSHTFSFEKVQPTSQ